MKLVSWNVAGRVVKLERQAAALERQQPDLVCLQEVRPSTLQPWRAACAQMGLAHFAESSAVMGKRRLLCATASRWPLRALAAVGAPYPERVVSVVVETPAGELELHNTHVPPAPSNGLIKVETLEAIYFALARPSDRHRILCGDLNVPRLETEEGEVITFADNHPDQLQRWDRAERCLLTELVEWDLRDCFRRVHGYQRRDVSWVMNTRSARKAGHRLDHILASDGLGLVDCDYHHEWRDAGLSDHSAMEAIFAPKRLPQPSPSK